MQRKPNILLAIITSLICLVVVVAPILAAPEDSTDSANIDPETIKENIKKRIEQVIKNQSGENKKRTAYLGTLNSVTTNSFSLETTLGSTKQASTSATTVVIELPKNKEVQFADVSIGDYVAALGFVNDTTKVLDARRILVLKDKPEQPSRKPVFGIISHTDLKKNTITLKDKKSDNETIFKISTKADIQITDGSPNKVKLTIKDIPPNASCLVIFDSAETEKGTNIAVKILIKSIGAITPPGASPSPTPKSSPSPKATTKPSPSPKPTPST